MTSPATLSATDARHRQLLASHTSNNQTNDHEVGSSSFASRVVSESSSFSSDSDQTLVTNSMSEEEHVKSSDDQIEVKDPRIRARKYQLELCKKAVEENIIVYLGTGYGKTHIAVLLIYELGHLIKKPQKNVCVFLAPTVPLVQQQASVIEEFTDFKVGSYYGQSKRINNHQEWEKEIEEIEVLVMTPQILLHNLFHRLIKMELIALLIFDECHHAQAQSSHPYAQIMKEYKISSTRRPRIFGMTASPIVGKGGECLDSLPRGINSLEELLDAKVCSVEDSEELERFVATPKFKCYFYVPVSDCTLKKNYLEKLEGIKNECIQTQRGTTDDVKILRNNRKVLQRLQDNLQFCLDNLGLWGAVQAIRILLTGDQSDLADMIDAKGDLPDNLTTQYLTQAASIVDSNVIKDGDGFDSSVLESLHDPMFSKKLLVLVQILSSCRLQPDMKCIVFVNRIIVARTLSYILGNLKCLSFWKARFLAGFHSGVKTMSRKNMNSIVEKFRSGELNLLVATRVGEEGLDIQTCCLVIRFDLPETVASFIQSRGRARMPQSEYVFLVESENQSELNLVKHFLSEEDRMNKEITHRTSGETFDVLEEAYYRVPSTGASISAGYSVSLLHCYCSKLPRDEYFIPKPEFFFFDDNGGTFCRIILPSNAPVHEVCSPPQSSKEKAKKIACLTACKELHALGALTDYLLPPQDDELDKASIEFDTYEDEASRGELHEMLSPAALKDPWTNSESSILLNFYYIQFDPVPNDRLYQKFGLFVKDPLPKEAETMELDLHLAHGRIVKTKLVPLGVIQCGKDEIIQAQNFQELFLKLILDRDDFFADFVPLGKNDPAQSKPSKFYLLVPVRENKIGSGLTVNWRLIRRCLSSPVFKAQNNVLDLGLVRAGNSLILADGLSSTSDIVNSLVFTPHNKLFFFVDDVLHGIDANSHFADRSSSNYRDHYAKKFGIHLLHPEQPLLKAKQLFSLHNLLHNRVQENTEARALEEHFVELPPELCTLKIIGFSKDIGSSLSLLPSLMHRLENLLVAIELKSVFSHSFPEGSEVTAHRVLEAITTEKSLERFSLERLEVLGDAFLKYAVGRHVFLLHETVDEGQLTRKRSSFVNNVHLYNLAIRSNLPVYIRDENFDPSQFFALGRPCKMICNESTESSIHYQQRSENIENEAGASIVKCSKGHHWLHKKTIADVVEALVGAFIVDSGFKAAIAFLKWIGIQVDFEASQVSEICMASKSYMSLSSDIDTSALENSLGYKFLHKGLLLQAFVHPSYNKHIGGCYQRLEFLGDAVLDYLITSYLFSVYPRLKPGQLTDLRSVTVNNNVFAHVAVCRSFHKYLISDSDALTEAVQKFVNYSVTCSAEQLAVEGPRHPKALGDLVESCVGAILLDSGFNLKLVWKIVLSFLDPIMSFSTLQFNPVRELTELCQSHDWDLQFSIIKKGGTFSADASLVGNSFSATGQGTNPSKKAAMRTAAREIFLKLKGQGYVPKKSNSLERLLKSSGKQEAKLIGYDEVPTPSIILDEMHIEKLNVQEASPASGDNTLDSKVVNNESANISPFRRRSISMIEAPRGHFGEVTEDSSSSVKSQNGGIDCSRTSNDNNLAINLPPFSRRPIEAQGMHYGEVTKGLSFVANTQKRGIVCSPASNDNKTDTNISPARRKPITKNEAQVDHYPKVIEEGSSVCKSHNRDMLPNLTTKSHLFEICAANYWKHPVFECVKEEGQAHLKSFIIKVTVEIVEVPDTILECFSDPLPKKKAAEEHAAEGALWYLHHKGYSLKDI